MFARLILFPLKWEGGFVDHPNDPGGRTNMGITQKTFDAWRDARKEPRMDVKHIKKPEVMDIYYQRYWKPEWEKLGVGLAACMLDTAINMGMGRAESFLKQCEGSYVKYIQLRIERYDALIKANPKLAVFRKGWMARVTDLRRWIEVEIQNDKQFDTGGSG